MDTRNGDIYASRALAEAAGVPDEDLVTGSREALDKLDTPEIIEFRALKPPRGRRE